MKFLFTGILCCIFLFAKSQPNERHIPYDDADYLVAKNDKRIRKYNNGRVLKIYYKDSISNSILKAKGRLYIINENEVRMIPFGRKDIVSINVHSIISIGVWARNAKISTAVNAGLGIAAVSLALSTKGNNYDSAGNIILFIPLAIAILELYYVGISIPIFILKELISKRSVKQGYHFYVEDFNLKTNKVI
jgi:NADH:ubiquinone oxidoreductase subunit K